jgi:hypothetical protein
MKNKFTYPEIAFVNAVYESDRFKNWRSYQPYINEMLYWENYFIETGKLDMSSEETYLNTLCNLKNGDRYKKHKLASLRKQLFQ